MNTPVILTAVILVILMIFLTPTMDENRNYECCGSDSFFNSTSNTCRTAFTAAPFFVNKINWEADKLSYCSNATVFK